MIKKEVKKQPPTLSDVGNYLMQQQNLQAFNYYNEVISIVTIVIAVLTFFSILIGIGNLTSNSDIKYFIEIIGWSIVFVFIISLPYLLYRIVRAKLRLSCILYDESILTGKIIRGDIYDAQKIYEEFIELHKRVKIGIIGLLRLRKKQRGI